MHLKADTLYDAWTKMLEAYFDGRLRTKRFSGRDMTFNLVISSGHALGLLRPELVGYSPAKLSTLTTAYVPMDRLHALKQRMAQTTRPGKLRSFQMSFEHRGSAAKRRDGCLVGLAVVQRPDGRTTLTIFARASELIRTFVGDLCLAHQIARLLLDESQLERTTLCFHIAYGYFSSTKAIVLLGHPAFAQSQHPLLAKARVEAGASSSKLASIQRLLNFHRGRVGQSGTLSTLF
jgi:hypothetical protein